MSDKPRDPSLLSPATPRNIPDPDAPLIPEDKVDAFVASLFEQQRRIDEDPAAAAEQIAKVRDAAREREEKRKTPRLSIAANIEKLAQLATAFGETIKQQAYISGQNSDIIDEQIQRVMVEGFKALVHAMDHQNHSAVDPQAPDTDAVIDNLITQLKALPPIAAYGERAENIAKNLIIPIVPPALKAATAIGIEGPYVSKRRFFSGIFTEPDARKPKGDITR